jgi:hypothetical protein
VREKLRETDLEMYLSHKIEICTIQDNWKRHTGNRHINGQSQSHDDDVIFDLGK